MSFGIIIPSNEIIVFTDGSYDQNKEIGAWAAIILIAETKHIIQDVVSNSTHQRMELIAVINTLEYLSNEGYNSNIKIYTDSQYVCGLIPRLPNLKQANFLTKAKKELVNTDLIKRFLSLTDSIQFELIKVKAHLKETNENNYNREVDKLVRRLVRAEK